MLTSSITIFPVPSPTSPYVTFVWLRSQSVNDIQLSQPHAYLKLP